MKITKFNHSSFLLEKDGRGLLFDPVEYTDKLPEITNLDIIFITHTHGDHFQPEVLGRIREANLEAKIFVTEDNENMKNVTTIARGEDKVSVGVFDLEFYGGDHAEILVGQVPCRNIGVVVDGVFANSGDSFDIPPVMPKILVAPIAAPWLKLAETKAFIEAVKPKVVIPTHDGLNSKLGNMVCDNWVSKACEGIIAKYKEIHFGEVIE